jgi:hypothetical protein
VGRSVRSCAAVTDHARNWERVGLREDRRGVSAELDNSPGACGVINVARPSEWGEMVLDDDPFGRLLDDAMLAVAQRVKPAHSSRASWIVSELGTARQASTRSWGAVASGDTLGHLLYFRLVTEVAIRLAWVARHAFVREPTEQAVDSILRRDLLTFAKAAERTGGQANRAAETEAAKIAAKPAPAQLDRLATEGDANGAYRYFRLCSALIHPGIGRRTLKRFPPGMTHLEARDYALQCVANADEALAAVGTFVGLTPEVDVIASAPGSFV